MTAYEYDNLPSEMTFEALPEDMVDEAQEAFLDALDSNQLLAREVKVAYVYDRRSYMSLRSFLGNDINTDDDVIIQMTIRVPNPKNAQRESLKGLVTLEEHLTERALKVERERLETEIAADEAAAEKAQSAARQKREQLKALHDKK